MSLINQMLKDLDARCAADGASNRLVSDLTPVRSQLPSEAFSPRWLGLPLLVGCAVFALVQLAPALPAWQSWAGWVADRAAPRPVTHESTPVEPVALAPDAGSAGAPLSSGLRLTTSLAMVPEREYGLDLEPGLRAEAAHLNAMLDRDPPAARRPAPEPPASGAAEAADRPEAPVAVALAAPPAAAEPIPLKRALPETAAERAEKIFERAVAALSAGDARGGEAELAAALEAWPGHVKARELLAAQLVSAGHTGRALELLAGGRRAVPGEAAFVKLEARVLVDDGRLEEALSVLIAAPAELARDAQYHALEAAVAQRLERHEQAVEAYRRALNLRPSGLWWMGLGISLEALRLPADALRAFRQAAASPGLGGDVRRYVESRIRSLRG